MAPLPRRFDTWDGSQNLGRASFATRRVARLRLAARRALRRRAGRDPRAPGARGADPGSRGDLAAPAPLESPAQRDLRPGDDRLRAVGRDGGGRPLFVDVAERKARLTLEHAPTDGAWPEGVSYWGYGLSYFVRMLEAQAAARTGRRRSPGTRWLRKTGDYFVYLSLPEAHWKKGTVAANIADAPLDGGPNGGVVLRRLASAYGNGVYQHFADALMRDERLRNDGSGRHERAHASVAAPPLVRARRAAHAARRPPPYEALRGHGPGQPAQRLGRGRDAARSSTRVQARGTATWRIRSAPRCAASAPGTRTRTSTPSRSSRGASGSRWIPGTAA